MSELPHVFDATTETFEADVLQQSMQTPVLVDFWATWCGPCKTLGPVLEKLAAEFNGGFLLAKVDVDKEQQLAGYFQIKSVPTVMLVKDGQIVDGFPGALPEGQLRQFLGHHGVLPREAEAPVEEAEPAPLDPHEEVVRLRAATQAEPDKEELKLDLAGCQRQMQERVAGPLGLEPTQAADGILRIAVTQMSHAVKAVTTERGLDAGSFTMVVYGGAGPLHASAIARELGIRKVLIPYAPGYFSAYGMLFSDRRYDYVRSVFRKLDGICKLFIQRDFFQLAVAEGDDLFPHFLQCFGIALELALAGAPVFQLVVVLILTHRSLDSCHSRWWICYQLLPLGAGV